MTSRAIVSYFKKSENDRGGWGLSHWGFRCSGRLPFAVMLLPPPPPFLDLNSGSRLPSIPNFHGSYWPQQYFTCNSVLEKSCRIVNLGATPTLCWQAMSNFSLGQSPLSAERFGSSSASRLYSPTLTIAELSCKRDRASKPHLDDKGEQV